MKLLEYKIAWIDDQPSRAEGFHQRLSSFVARYGFSLKVDWISRENDLNTFLNSLGSNSDFDLILVDWKLGAMVKPGKDGSTVARDIRFRNPPSYVVFYSSEARPKLMQLIAKESIDGVYCVNREQFYPETKEVISASIRRFQDVETMRGIFLSAVASFDSIVKESLLNGFEKLPESFQKKVIDSLLERLETFHTNRIKAIQSVDRTLKFSEMLSKLNAGSNQELSCLIDLLSLASPSVNYRTYLEQLKTYQRDFLPGRNDLAHVEESISEEHGVIARNGRVWNPVDLGQYRQQIVDHNDTLNYVRDALIQELVDHLAA